VSFSDFWPYLLIIPVLLLGTLTGWLLRITYQRRHPAGARFARELNARLARAAAEVDEQKKTLRAAEADLSRLSMRLVEQNRLIVRAREHLEQQNQEHNQILLSLDEQQAAVKDASSNLRTVEDDLRDRRNKVSTLLDDVSKHIEEIEWLERLGENYAAKIDRLTQQVQWQDSELRMLRQTAKNKTREIDEAQALLERREAELRRLIRRRQQREIDLAHARRALAGQDTELRRLLDQQEESEPILLGPPPSDGSGQSRIDITPPQPPGLAPGDAPLDEDEDREPEEGAGEEKLEDDAEFDDDQEDDLTQIDGLYELYARQLRAHGITSFRRLARMRPADVDRILDIPGHYSPDIPGWIEAAGRLAAGRKSGDNGSDADP
jgi:predicted flap endonuclease-1-like 5' DNA nuclease